MQGDAPVAMVVFNVDFTGSCDGCSFGDAKGAVAIVGCQFHSMLYLGMWIYSFFHREVFVILVNIGAALAIHLSQIVHKIEVVGISPPCLSCIGVYLREHYALEGSAIPCIPVVIITYYTIILYYFPLEVVNKLSIFDDHRDDSNAAFSNDEGIDSRYANHLHDNDNGDSRSKIINLRRHIVEMGEDDILWENLSHINIFYIPCFVAASRLYAGLTTHNGVMAGCVIGSISATWVLNALNSRLCRVTLHYIFVEARLPATIVRYLGFSLFLMRAMWAI